MGLLRHFLLAGILAGLGMSQDCPLLGPAYPEVSSLGSSTAFKAAQAAIDDEIAKALAGGQLDPNTSFGIRVFSKTSDKALYEKYHGSSLNADTVVSIASISKLITVYATLTEIGDKYWDEPITKYVPELANHKVKNPVYDINWDEITLGALASHLAGIPQHCKIPVLASVCS
jgi:CubicO group peptidase (beta-lactamase class C family)